MKKYRMPLVWYHLLLRVLYEDCPGRSLATRVGVTPGYTGVVNTTNKISEADIEKSIQRVNKLIDQVFGDDDD